MAHSQQIKTAVRNSYVRERLPLEQAAEKHAVSYHTSRKWKKLAKANGDDWDTARNASAMAGGELGDLTNQVIEDFMIFFQTTMEDVKNGDYTALQKAEVMSRISDSYAKTMKAAGGGNVKIAELAVALKVIELLPPFIKENKPELLTPFIELLAAFGAKISEEFG